MQEGSLAIVVGAFLYMCVRWYRILRGRFLGLFVSFMKKTSLPHLLHSISFFWTFSLWTLSSFQESRQHRTQGNSNSNNAQPSTRLEQPGSWDPRRCPPFTALARSRQRTRPPPAVCLWGSPHLSHGITNERVACSLRSPKSSHKIRAST